MEQTQIAASALIENNVTIGKGTIIWHRAHVRNGAKIGVDCIIGSGAFIDSGVVVGNLCKIQNGAQVFSPAVVHDGVFIGPNVILTNDRLPRAVNSDLTIKELSDWNQTGVEINKGATIGAGSICIAPIRVGIWAFIAAGSVVVSNIPDYAFFKGVPARQDGWVSKNGNRLKKLDSEMYLCEVTGEKFRLFNGIMECLNETN